MQIEIKGDGKYIITKVIDGKVFFTLSDDFIKRFETLELLLSSQIPLVDFLKNEVLELKVRKNDENRPD